MKTIYIITLIFDLEYPEIWDAFIINKYGPNPEEHQHHFMMENYINILGSALQEYHTGIPPLVGSEPQQQYTDIAWAGLTRLPYFQTIPSLTDEDRDRIIKRIEVETNNQAEYGIQPSTLPCN